jgi:hypothetical protein
VNKPIRVAQWGTGNTGSVVMQAIRSTPGLDLIGVRAHNPAKAGRDTAELLSLNTSIGVPAWSTADEMVAAAARRDIAEHWRHEQGYGVEIHGVPGYDLHLRLRDPAGKRDRPARLGTAMYNVNILPALVAAEPGIRTPFELAVTGCRKVGGRHQDDNWTLSAHLHAEQVGGQP